MLNLLKKFFRKRKATCSVVIVAAGSSNRMKGTDKILYELGQEPLIAHTIRAFQINNAVKEIVLVTRNDLVKILKSICEDKEFHKVTAVISGGDNRVQSVMNGLNNVSKDCGYVAIHDGARPFVTQQIITDTIAFAAEYHAAAPAVAVKDTIKVAQGNIVKETPNRADLFAVQTPQIFDFDLLRGALGTAIKNNTPITDDCSAVEAMGMSVYLTKGDDENIKITTPTDLILAQAIWEGRQKT